MFCIKPLLDEHWFCSIWKKKQPPPKVFCKKRYSKFRKIHRKTPVSEYLLINLHVSACNFIKKETPKTGVSMRILRNFKNTFFTEHLNCFWWKPIRFQVVFITCDHSYIYLVGQENRDGEFQPWNSEHRLWWMWQTLFWRDFFRGNWWLVKLVLVYI